MMKTTITCISFIILQITFGETNVKDQISFNKDAALISQLPSDSTKKLKSLNIDFMNRGYFYAYSTPKNSEEDEGGGWAISSNRPNKISKQDFPANLFTIIIDTNQVDT